jgi:hypothetical protein
MHVVNSIYTRSYERLRRVCLNVCWGKQTLCYALLLTFNKTQTKSKYFSAGMHQSRATLHVICSVASNISGSQVQNLLHATLITVLSSSLALRSMQDPGFLQEQFLGVCIPGYFSAASTTHFLHIVFSVVQPFLSWLSNLHFSFWHIFKDLIHILMLFRALL